VYNLDRIVTSTERKAIETGELAAKRLAIPCQTAEGLHEHQRDTVPYFDSPSDFLAAVTRLFDHPNELVLGEETGLQARTRFTTSVENVMRTHPLENIAIVTHGTVLSLFVSQFTEIEVSQFWRSLGMPAITAFTHPDMKLLAQENEITENCATS
jgi:broad specificity phosphatase PhoE